MWRLLTSVRWKSKKEEEEEEWRKKLHASGFRNKSRINFKITKKKFIVFFLRLILMPSTNSVYLINSWVANNQDNNKTKLLRSFLLLLLLLALLFFLAYNVVNSKRNQNRMILEMKPLSIFLSFYASIFLVLYQYQFFFSVLGLYFSWTHVNHIPKLTSFHFKLSITRNKNKMRYFESNQRKKNVCCWCMLDTINTNWFNKSTHSFAGIIFARLLI